MKKLPEAEVDVMTAIWGMSEPVVATQILEQINQQSHKEWKLQSVHTLLSRLEKKGFLTSEKSGKQRYFISLISQAEYAHFETESFVKNFHKGSLLNLMNSLYDGDELSNEDIAELESWLKEVKKHDG